MSSSEKHYEMAPTTSDIQNATSMAHNPYYNHQYNNTHSHWHHTHVYRSMSTQVPVQQNVYNNNAYYTPYPNRSVIYPQFLLSSRIIYSNLHENVLKCGSTENNQRRQNNSHTLSLHIRIVVDHLHTHQNQRVNTNVHAITRHHHYCGTTLITDNIVRLNNSRSFIQ